MVGGFSQLPEGDCPGPNFAQNQNEKFSKKLKSSHKEKFDGAGSEVFSQLPETDCPGPEETEEGARNLYAPSWWPRQVPFMRQLIETEEERK